MKKEVREVVAKWADKAWGNADGNWEAAEDMFIDLWDAELPKIADDDPDLAQEIERAAVRHFGNQQISFIVEQMRALSRARNVAATPATPQTKGTPTGARSKRTAAAMARNRETRKKAFLASYNPSLWKKLLGDT